MGCPLGRIHGRSLSRKLSFLFGACLNCLHVFTSRSRDFYHTCYCLSGLSVAQHFGSGDLLHEVVLGVPENRLVSCTWMTPITCGVLCTLNCRRSHLADLISHDASCFSFFPLEWETSKSASKTMSPPAYDSGGSKESAATGQKIVPIPVEQRCLLLAVTLVD